MTEKPAPEPESQSASTTDEAETGPEADAAPSGDAGSEGGAPAGEGSSGSASPEGSAAGGAGRSPEAMDEARAEEELSRSLDDLQDEFATLNDRHLRLAAEFSNYRRRQESEMTEAWGRAQADLVRRLLDVLDDLQRVSALDPADEAVTVQSIVEGIDMVERKFVRALEDAGARAVEPPEGDAFDPETMEAMMRVPTDDDHADDTVARCFQKGYTFRNHLVRPARVSVYKA
jgi:molecular chaperone GrpE